MACIAILGVGYIISAEDAKALKNNEKWEDDVIPLNCYDDNSDCFVGEVLSACDPGEFTKAFIPNSIYAHTNVVETKFSSVIPDKYGYADVYILSVWD